MTNGFLARKSGWMIVCGLAGFVAAFAYSEGQAVKQALIVTGVGNVGQLAEPFILMTVFWAAIGILVIGAFQLFRN